ncbi:MAG: SusD/RagB family nutrient-binding outer membrane lipoprotein [Flavisolibacter sp.]
MKKYLFIISSCLFLAACTKNISDLNQETKKAANVPAASLFANATKNLTDYLASTSVNINVFRLVTGQWATTTYQDEPNYDFTTRNIPQTWWTWMYRDVLVDLKESKKLIPSTPIITEGAKKNRIAMVDVMEVLTWSILVNTFGDVPYTDALDYNKLFPKYDDAKTIYDDLIARLNNDIASLSTAEKGFDAPDDIIYGGSVSAWIKFANTLKMRMGMMLADVDAAKAKTLVEQASPNAFSSASDNAIFKYLSVTPNNNPIWTDLIQSNRQDFIAANTLVDNLKALNDPRLPFFFRVNDAGQYVGGIEGANNTFTLFAKPSDKVAAINFPAVLLDYSDAEFDRAEAIERGFSVAGTAEQHYNNAIRASILYWGGTNAQADAYLLQPSVAYTTAPGNFKQKIGTQKWIALYNRGYELWTEIRRLDYPVLPLPAAPKSGFPVRLLYPTNEQTLNGDSYTAAAAKIGGDKVETKIFWDKY